ncbi:HAD family hydrolase [Silvibacterium acidisoli]|uniref:HAD family hydrolase n=1 Tax=Acidobacteriaceae bacterium ZG23-2 TaxID=2883246 RepID=UPI00406BEBCF
MTIALDPGSFDALIFDCDGTLVDTAALHLRTLRMGLAEHGLNMETGWYMQRAGLAPADLLKDYETLIQPLPVAHEELWKRVAEFFQANMHTLEEVTIVADVARAWHGRVPMGVASNGEGANVVGSLKAAGLFPLFDSIVAIEDVRHGKPAPDIYLEAARRLNITPSRCLVLEDSDEGLRAAKAAGMRAIDIRPHYALTQATTL